MAATRCNRAWRCNMKGLIAQNSTRTTQWGPIRHAGRETEVSVTICPAGSCSILTRLCDIRPLTNFSHVVA